MEFKGETGKQGWMFSIAPLLTPSKPIKRKYSGGSVHSKSM